MKHRIVTPGQSLPRWPLDRWETVLQPVLKQTVSAENSERWCLAMNNQALIHMHRGDTGAATASCLDQIAALFAARHDMQGHVPAGMLALQPLVNLIRLSRGGADAFLALHEAARTRRPALAPPVAPARHIAMVVAALAKDKEAMGYVAGLAAAALARKAFVTRDADGISQAHALSAGALRQELAFVLHLWAAQGPAAETWAARPKGAVLAQLYHLLCHPRGLAPTDRAALALTGAGQACAAVLEGGAPDTLETALDFLDEARAMGADDDLVARLAIQIDDVAESIGDQVTQFRILQLRSDAFGEGRTRLNALIAQSGYDRIRNTTLH